MGKRTGHRGWIFRIRGQAGVALLALGLMFVPALIAGRPAQTPEAGPTYRVLLAFKGFSHGAGPYADLIRDSSGNLYGTTFEGGDGNINCIFGCGVVFKVSTIGHETVLYRFTGSTDGNGPGPGLVGDSSSNLYGTTVIGGTTNACGGMGCGVVFKLSPTGQETVLYSFAGGGDGANPGGLIRDSSGNLYGIASGGDAYGFGVVFKLSSSGQETVLYSFSGGADGANPGSGLIRDSSGNLYGTAGGGLSNGCVDGFPCGVVFEVNPTDQESVLYSFTGGADGANPGAGLVRDSSGNLYGTTVYGGGTSCNSGFGCGVVFELSPTGQESVLYSFTGGADGAHPYASVIRESSGNLYGTTAYGGAYSKGVVFELSVAGQEKVLHSFTGLGDGGNPFGSVTRDPSGNLYGTTPEGGDSTGCEFSNGCGVVFELTP